MTILSNMATFLLSHFWSFQRSSLFENWCGLAQNASYRAVALPLGLNHFRLYNSGSFDIRAIRSCLTSRDARLIGGFLIFAGPYLGGPFVGRRVKIQPQTTSAIMAATKIPSCTCCIMVFSVA
jgi:hypothetical protein